MCDDHDNTSGGRLRRRRLVAGFLFYPTLAWNLLLARVFRLRRWWDRVDPHVVLGAFPFARDVPGLKAEGIGAVVNTCQEYAGPVDAYERAGIEQLRIPTVDFTHPALKDVERAVEFMQEQIAAGRQVYVHCKAGRARSATVVLCWLVTARELDPESAQELILAARPHANRHLVDRPVIQQYWQNHGRSNSGR